jgi:adenylate kinase family enzyme
MRENRNTTLAVTIQDRLDNQGFLTSEELNPFISRATQDALSQQPQKTGILVDGFPRSTEQLESWSVWPFPENLPIASGTDTNAKPDIVLSLRISKQNAKARYSARARESNDSDGKFERRFAEYEQETVPVEESYRQRGILIDVSGQQISKDWKLKYVQIDVNGSKEENIAEMTERLSESELWQRIMVERRKDTHFIGL